MKRELYNVFPQLDATGDFVSLDPVNNIVVEMMVVLISNNGLTSTRMWDISFGAGLTEYLFSLASKNNISAVEDIVLSSLQSELTDIRFDYAVSKPEVDKEGNIISILVEIGFVYDNKEYISTILIPRTISLLEGPLYSVKLKNQVPVNQSSY